jgi:hypothetical protein
MNPSTAKLLVALALAGGLNIPLGFSQGTAITYQGRLADGASPANGTYDLRFILYDNSAGGSQQGPILTNTSTSISNGLFTVSLDFGAQFPGANRWLEIAVRTNGTGSFTTLSSRQFVAPTPYAVTAENVVSGGLASGTYSSAVNFNNSANSFTGNGGGLTNVNAATLNGLTSSNFWKTAGNAGTTAGANFIGTTDNQPLELRVNGSRTFRLEPNTNGAPNIIAGSTINYVSNSVVGATISGGGALTYNSKTLSNSVTADFGTIGGGWDNTAGNFATVGGGQVNIASGPDTTVAGGFANFATGFASTVAGGENDNASGDSAFIGGGYQNNATAYATTVAGGYANNASGYYSTIGGGQYNQVAGGFQASSTVAGGYRNNATNDLATVGGGYGNIASGPGSVISGGGYDGGNSIGNLATGAAAVVGGGLANKATNNYAVVSGGDANIASGYTAFVGGGYLNTAAGQDSAVVAGAGCAANASWSVVGGGYGNQASGLYSTVPGGIQNQANGDYSLAAGYGANAAHQGAFVWGDSQGGTYSSDRANQFKVRASGGMILDVSGSSGLNPAALRINSISANGVGIFVAQTSSDATAVFTAAGTGDIIKGFNADNNGNPVFEVINSGDVYAHSFNSTSDRNAKENFAAVSTSEILDRVLSLPVTRWNFKSETDKEHLGPMAQDFHAAFGLNGGDDKHISLVDESGVALAAIQGLDQKLEERSKQMELRSGRLEAENAELRQTVENLKQLVAAMSRKLDERFSR